MSEAATKNQVVSIAYVLRDDDGKELDKATKEEPLRYLHGAKNIVPGLEKALEGKKAGETFDVDVPPKEGYGEKAKVKTIRARRSELPDDAVFERGTQFFLQDPKHGTFPVWVERVQGSTIMLTPLHPLAGKTLHFSVEVLEVREATEEELSHGHVHGPGGHHHDEDGEEGGETEEGHGHGHG